MKPFLLLALLPLAGCGMIDVVSQTSVGEGKEGPRAVGTGKPVVETRRARAVTAAEFSGALKVEIRQGAPALVVEAQKELLPHVRSSFESGRLRIWTEGSVQADSPIRVRLSTPSLAAIVANGATIVEVDTLAGKAVEVDATGASRIEASGKVDRLGVKVDGASHADLTGLRADAVRVEASGASGATVNAVRSLDATASGASTIRYQGHPALARAEATGASSIGPG